jgi:hypothetical protein
MGDTVERFTVEARQDQWGDWYNALIDGRTGDVVFEDGGEPEDQTLTRDFAPLVQLLNQLAREAIF